MTAPFTGTTARVLLVATVSLVLGGACATGPFSSGDIEASARALAIQPDGKLVLAGTAGVGNRLDFALARYLPDGSLDPAFGNAGKITTHFKDSPSYAKWLAGAYARGIAVQPDGKLVAAGATTIGGFMTVRVAYALARYRTDGSLDPAFGATGTVTTEIEQSMYTVPTLALQPDGKLIVGGDARVGDRFVFALIRYLPDGGLDPTFGRGGKVTTDCTASPSFSSVRAITHQPDGKLVAAGLCVVGRRDHFTLARYLADGSLDTTFGNGGMVTTEVAFGAPVTAQQRWGQIPQDLEGRGALALALQPDGKIIAAGATEALNGRVVFALARFLPDGSLDRSFGTEGAVATDFGEGGVAVALALQPDGKVVAAGATGAKGTTGLGALAAARFALARYLPNGSLDGSFGEGGKVIGDFGWYGVLALGLLPDGKLVAAGAAKIGGRRIFGLARYLPDGTLDPAFGVKGQVVTDFGEATSP